MLAFVLCCHEYDCGILLSSTILEKSLDKGDCNSRRGTGLVLSKVQTDKIGSDLECK